METWQARGSSIRVTPLPLVRWPSPLLPGSALEQIRTWPALISAASSGSVPEHFRPVSGSPTAQQASDGRKALFVDRRLSRPANVPHNSILRALKPFPRPGVSPFLAAEAPAAGELAALMSATMRPGSRWPCRHGQGEEYARICFSSTRAPDKKCVCRARSDRKKTAGLRAGYSLEAPTVQQENSCYCPFPGSLVKAPSPRI